MSSSIRLDLIKDSGFVEERNDSMQLVYAAVDRSFYVDEISGDPDTIQTQAIELIKTVVPVGTPHSYWVLPDPPVPARRYRAVPWASHQGCQVIVTYEFRLNNSVLTEFSIECSGGLAQYATDSEFTGDTDDSLVPIEVNYWRNWAHPTDTPSTDEPFSASVTDMPVLRPVGGITLVKSIDAAKAAAIEADKDDYLGKLNDAVFRGKAIKTLLLSEAVTIAQPYAGIYLARCRWDYQPKTWDPWARFRNEQFGVPSNIWRDEAATPDDMANSNGFKRCRGYLTANMTTFFNLVTG